MRKIIVIFLFLFPFFVFGQANNSIKGYWPLNGSSADISGNSHTGTDSFITYSLMNGKFNQGAGMNGLTSSIVTTGNIGISGDLTMTVSFWVNVGSVISSTYTFVQWGTAGATSFIFITGFCVFGDVAMCFSGTGGQYACAPITLTSGKWYYIVGTKSAGTISNTTCKIYINGVQVPSLNFGTTTAPAVTNSPVSIGYDSQYAGGLPLTGAIDEVIVDNTVWSAAKVSWMYNQYLGIF